MSKIEALARYLNEISQIDIHYDNCSKKIQKAYLLKAEGILQFIEDYEETKKD